MHPRTFRAAVGLTILVGILSSSADETEPLSLSPARAYLVVDRWAVNFTCTVNTAAGHGMTELTSSNMTFYWSFARDGSWEYIRLPDSCTTQVNHTTMELNQCDRMKSHANRTYISCRMRHDKTVTSNEAIVDVKDPHPRPRVLLDDAVVHNWDSLTVIVDTGEDLNRMHTMSYSVFFRGNSNRSTDQNASFEKINGSLLKVTVENAYQVAHPTDVLVIKIDGTFQGLRKTPVETTTSGDVRLNLNRFVKPAKVTNIEVLQNDSSLPILSFDPPKPNRNINYSVEIVCEKASKNHTTNVTDEIKSHHHHYHRHHHDHPRHRIANKTERQRVSMELAGLPPFSNCTAFVRAISADGGSWSDWNTHTFETLEGVLYHNPNVCSSCFSVHDSIFDSVFDLVVYFTPISDMTSEGKVVQYRIRISEKNSTNESNYYLNNTGQNRFSFVLKNLSKRIDHQISIEAGTSKGYSRSIEMSNRIEISRRDDQSLSYPKDFTAVILNSTAVRTSWRMDYDPVCNGDKKTFLFWCEGNFQTRNCSDVLKWKKVSPDSSSDVIDFPGDKFIFGIAFECDGKSSGILWNHCVYHVDNSPPKPTIESIITSATSATIHLGDVSECPWSGIRFGLAVTYQLSYCRVHPDIENECIDNLRSSFHNRSHGKLLNISGLDQDQKYRLSIQSFSETNKSSDLVDRVFSTTSADPTKSGDPTGAILAVPVVFGVLLVVVATVLALRYRSYFLNLEYEIPVVVKTTIKQAPDMNLNAELYDDVSGDVIENRAEAVDSAGCRDQVPDLDGSATDGAELSPTLRSEVMFASLNPLDHNYFRVGEGLPAAATEIPASLSNSFHARKLPFETEEEIVAFRVLPHVCGNRNDGDVAGRDFKITEEEQHQKEQLVENQELDREQHSASNSDCSPSGGDYMRVAVGDPVAPEAEDSSNHGDSGYIDGSARIASVIQPPPSEPAKSLELDQDFAENSATEDYQSRRSNSPATEISIETDCRGSSRTIDTQRGQLDLYSAITISHLNSEIDGGDETAWSESSKSNHESNPKLQTDRQTGSSDTHPFTVTSGDNSVDADTEISSPEFVLPVCNQIVDVYCSGFEQSCSAFSEQHTPPSVIGISGVTPPPENDVGISSYPDLQVTCRSDLFTCPTDFEMADHMFSSENILPPIILT